MLLQDKKPLKAASGQYLSIEESLEYRFIDVRRTTSKNLRGIGNDNLISVIHHHYTNLLSHSIHLKAKENCF